MESSFWHDRWADGRIGFHEPDGNSLLAQHIASLNLRAGDRVFLPLAGKTRDIAWLLAQGYRVVANELSALAIDQLFDELDIVPDRATHGTLEHRSAPGLDVWVGDVFALTSEQLGPVQAVYDRAAMVALPEGMRQDYVRHIVEITAAAPQFLITFDYDQAQVDGPPFSVPLEQVSAYHMGASTITELARRSFRLKGKVPADEIAVRLDP